MNRRRELTLQRLARIGALPASESAVQTEKPETIAKIKPVGTLSIEAMLGSCDGLAMLDNLLHIPLSR